MSKLKVYISSTYMDMADAKIRNFLIDTIQNNLPDYFELTRIMEQMDGDFQNKLDVNICLENVRDADLYILLVGNRYGSSPEKYTDEYNNEVINVNGYSYTELEYITAVKCMETKFYGIYKFNVADAFFEETKSNDHSDLSDPVRYDKHQAFKKRLDAGSSMITIADEKDLFKKAYQKMSEFYMFSNKIIELKIDDYNKILINRETQKNIISQKKNPPWNTDDKPLGQTSKSVVFVFNSTCEKDDFSKFGSRIKSEVFDIKTDLLAPEYVSLSEIMGTCVGDVSDDDYKKIMNSILKNCSKFLFGMTNNACVFDTLHIDLKNQRVLNKFIYINIELMGNKDRDAFAVNIITRFIKKMEEVLNSIVDDDGNLLMSANLFFVLNLINENEDEYQKYYNLIDSSLKQSAPLIQIECINLTKLKKVPSEDVMNWLKQIINEKGITDKPEEIYKFLFSDTQAPPRYYREYIDLLEKKIKV